MREDIEKVLNDNNIEPTDELIEGIKSLIDDAYEAGRDEGYGDGHSDGYGEGLEDAGYDE